MHLYLVCVFTCSVCMFLPVPCMSVYLFHVCVCLPVPCVCVYQLRVYLLVPYVCVYQLCVYVYLFHVFTFICSMCLPVPCVLMSQALMGTYIDKKCPFTGNVSIRGRILSGVVLRMKMQRTIVIRREYLHYVKKYSRFEKRHKNMSVHLSPAFKYVQCPVCTTLCFGEIDQLWSFILFSSSQGFVPYYLGQLCIPL